MAEQELPPEVLAAMLQMSGSEEERDLLKEQLAMSKTLADEAIGYNSKAPSNPIGGAAYVLGKGLLGYKAGQGIAEHKAESGALRGRNMAGRETWMKGYGSRGKKPLGLTSLSEDPSMGDFSGIPGYDPQAQAELDADVQVTPYKDDRF